MKHKNHNRQLFSILLSIMLFAVSIAAQTTAFSYQGRLVEAGNPVTGTRIFSFTLFDENGAAIPGATVVQTLSVTNGIFNTSLNFGAGAFPGANRALEIAVKINANDSFTILNLRQTILAAPYAIKSKSSDTAINAVNLGGLDASQFVKFDGSGNVGISTTGTGSKLTVAGVIESTAGGIKFPDATTQTTAGLTSITTNSTLNGNGTSALPLGVTSPLMIRDLDNPARQPFQSRTVTTTSSGVIVVTVPVGKCLIVEFISGEQSVRSGSGRGFFIATVTQTSGNEVFRHIVPPTSSDSNVNFNLYHASQPLRMYVNAGQQLRVLFNSDIFSASVSVTGYYVDIP
jgi:hypothetical protein